MRFPMRPLARALCGVFIAAALWAGSVQAQNTTLWLGGDGEWSVSGKWSSGKPTGSSTAVLKTAGTVTISTTGEQCRSLWMGLERSNPTILNMTGGSLMATDSLRIGTSGDALISHTMGSISAPTFVLGSIAGGGTYLQSGGSLSVTRAIFGSGQLLTAVGSYSASFGTPTFTVTDSLILRTSGGMIFGAGTLTVGTGAAGGVFLNGGSFGIANSPTVVVSRLIMTSTSNFGVAVSTLGLAPVVSTGPIVMDGIFSVSDVLAPEGEYEVLRGNPLAGAFVFVGLPSEEWTWRVEGNSLFIVKGDVPVRPTTWSRLKEGVTH